MWKRKLEAIKDTFQMDNLITANIYSLLTWSTLTLCVYKKVDGSKKM